jgi:hypothetical protein
MVVRTFIAGEEEGMSQSDEESAERQVLAHRTR